jgi:MFS transporter, SP family, sugar:H+ symporter
MVAECGVFIVGVIIQLCSFDVWQQYAIGRLVSGLAVGALSAAVPMVGSHYWITRNSMLTRLCQYQAETAPAQIRGTLT